MILFALVFVLILPLVGLMYVDTMVVKREAKAQMEKVEKLRKQVEEDAKREAEPRGHLEQGAGLCGQPV